MDAERWQRLSPLLDALLEQEPPVRAESLASLREEDPQLAADLEQLLRLEEDSGDFLSEPVVPPTPGLGADSVVGPYRLERMLGEGGMGQVWLAQRNDGLYQRRVALKLLRPGLADPNLRLRFTRERQILARLEHPHIARLLDAGISGDGQPYLALEYVEGEPITDWCRAHDVTVDTRLRLFQQVCRALSHAHANLIVHRDLKPSNILVTPLGEVRLLDFGIAKLLDTPDNMPDRTRTGSRAFTLHYAAPEQLRGEPVTTMTDVYALGMVMFELLTDARPFRFKRQSDAEWEEAILHADPMRASASLQRSAEAEHDRDRAVQLRRRARMVAGDLDNIAYKALSKQPEKRYASVEALAQDVDRFRDGKPVHARPQALGYRLRKFVGRHRWALATAGLTALVVASAMGIIAWQARNAMREAGRAQAMQDFVVGLVEQAGNASDNGQIDLPALLDSGLQRIDRDLARQPEARAELYGAIAQMRAGLGDYPRARALFERQSALVASLPDAPAGLVLSASAGLGRILRLQGNPRACVDHMRKDADLALRQQGQLPLQVAEFFSQFGRCQRAIGQRETARMMFQRSLKLRQTLAGMQAGLVENKTDLANLHADAGDGARALVEYRAALAELQSRVGARHTLAIDMNRTICALERSEGRLLPAQRHCQAALDEAFALHGASHRATVDARRQLAALLVDQGRYAAAEQEFRQSRAWLLQRLGNRHTDVARDDNSLAVIAWERGNLREALRLFDRAIAILRDAPPPNNLASVMFNKAMVLHEAGADADAEALLRAVRALRVREVGAAHPLVGATDRLLGEAQAAQGKQAQAGRSLDSAVALTQAGFGPAHPHTRRAEISRARRLANVPATRAEALRTLDTLASLSGDDAESAKLRLRARTYAAEARCRAPAQRDAARRALQALRGELPAVMPEGGELAREVEAVAAACQRA